jgi:hypothetical protein
VWTLRGANLCAWEAGINPPLRDYEIAIDPVRGRVVFGVETNVEAQALRDRLLVSATYGFAGPSGAHPLSRPAAPARWLDQAPQVVNVSYHVSPTALRDALANLPNSGPPLIIEIQDSMTHDLDIGAVVGVGTEGTRAVLRLGRSLWIRAANGQRPVIRLARPLGFRPEVVGTDLETTLTVKLEGLYLTRGAGFAPTTALIEQAALNALEIDGCTLDPGGAVMPNGTRRPIRLAMNLTNDYGFAVPADDDAFEQTPRLIVRRSILGPLHVDSDYQLTLSDSIVDAGSGVGASTPAHAIRATTGVSDTEWGPELKINGVTIFGRTQVESVAGQGGIFVHGLRAHDNQKGCVKFSYFANDLNRLPPHHGCVFGSLAVLAFTQESFGTAGYAQLAFRSDRRLRENGPAYDEMGCFGYRRNTARWKNLNIRYREFMPAGVRPVLIAVT